jgi:hypothetical protein
VSRARVNPKRAMSRKQVCARARKAIGPTVAHKALKALGEEEDGAHRRDAAGGHALR